MKPRNRETENDQEGCADLLRKVLPPVPQDAEAGRDLWPAVLARMQSAHADSHWFDRVLLAALIVLMVIFPTSISLFLYYL